MRLEPGEDRAAFFRLVAEDAVPEVVAEGLRWTEGPAWSPGRQGFYFSEAHENRVWLWRPGEAPEVFLHPSDHANGNTVDRAGRLISCETSTRRVVRHHADGGTEVIASGWQGRRFSSPNDVIEQSNGAIWFTDPHYGYIGTYPMQGPRELEVNGVYRADPDGQVSRVLADFAMPNGLAFTPDERFLYVADSSASHFDGGHHHVRRFRLDGFALVEDGAPIVISPGVPDGLRIDAAGNLWISAGDGVHVYDPGHRLLGRILTGGVASNLAFGGADWKWLLMTGAGRVLALRLASPAL